MSGKLAGLLAFWESREAQFNFLKLSENIIKLTNGLLACTDSFLWILPNQDHPHDFP